VDAFDTHKYGPVLGPLVDVDRRRPLGPGEPDGNMRQRLAQVTVEAAFAHAKLVDAEMGGCCLSGAWLVHDFLDEAHTICQAIDTPTGSYWHAIMHRREGDFGNSKYWLRRVGRHAVLRSLSRHAAEIVAERNAISSTDRLVTRGEFDPFAFVDLVEGVERGRRTDARELCLDIQQAEWELLFDWCYRRAVGTTSRIV
jgi:hypothetical protein